MKLIEDSVVLSAIDHLRDVYQLKPHQYYESIHQNNPIANALRHIEKIVRNPNNVRTIGGKWNVVSGYLVCSRCNSAFTTHDSDGDEMIYYYCPQCGEKMDWEAIDDVKVD